MESSSRCNQPVKGALHHSHIYGPATGAARMVSCTRRCRVGIQEAASPAQVWQQDVWTGKGQPHQPHEARPWRFLKPKHRLCHSGRCSDLHMTKPRVSLSVGGTVKHAADTVACTQSNTSQCMIGVFDYHVAIAATTVGLKGCSRAHQASSHSSVRKAAQCLQAECCRSSETHHRQKSDRMSYIVPYSPVTL